MRSGLVKDLSWGVNLPRCGVVEDQFVSVKLVFCVYERHGEAVHLSCTLATHLHTYSNVFNH